MSVLIKGIDISNSCAECRFCVNGFTDEAPMYECACESYENVSVLVDDHGKPFDFRPDWCPLIEIQTPHGRLIDADKLITKVRKLYCKDCILRTGKKNGKRQYIYEIGEAPCRACWVDDMVSELADASTIIEAEGSEI